MIATRLRVCLSALGTRESFKPAENRRCQERLLSGYIRQSKLFPRNPRKAISLNALDQPLSAVRTKFRPRNRPDRSNTNTARPDRIRLCPKFFRRLSSLTPRQDRHPPAVAIEIQNVQCLRVCRCALPFNQRPGRRACRAFVPE